MSLLTEMAFAYSDFIGYGYTSCMTCHYNGAGGGTLNEYGKAVWASEIAEKPFWNSQASNDELAEKSGVWKSESLPWWWRPGLKYRGLWFQTDLGKKTSTSKYIQMQLDINNAFFFDEDQKHVLIASGGYVPSPQGSNGSKEQENTFISREFYYRWEIQERTWLYAGLLDKVYGIRTVDHTSYSRKPLGLAQNDQSHSLIYQAIRGSHEYFVQVFFGNLQQESDLRQVGATGLYEYQFSDQFRLGASYLQSKNNYVDQSRGSTHLRLGFGKGHSFLSEIGLIRDKNLQTEYVALGAYGLFQGTIRLKRGLNLISIGEYYKKDMIGSESDLLRWHLGVLYFPAQRYEIRIEAINSKSIAPDQVKDGGWMLLSQLHLSI